VQKLRWPDVSWRIGLTLLSARRAVYFYRVAVPKEGIANFSKTPKIKETQLRYMRSTNISG
jgi:hypothetical protein